MPPSLLTSNRTIFQPQCYHQSRFSRGSVFPESSKSSALPSQEHGSSRLHLFPSVPLVTWIARSRTCGRNQRRGSSSSQTRLEISTDWFISRRNVQWHTHTRTRTHTSSFPNTLGVLGLNGEIHRERRPAIFVLHSRPTTNIPTVCPQRRQGGRRQGSGYGETKGMEGERRLRRDGSGYRWIRSSAIFTPRLTFDLSATRLRTIGTVNILARFSPGSFGFR